MKMSNNPAKYEHYLRSILYINAFIPAHRFVVPNIPVLNPSPLIYCMLLLLLIINSNIAIALIYRRLLCGVIKTVLKMTGRRLPVP